jgi:hypothetical protein
VLLAVGIDANDQTYFKGAPFYNAFHGTWPSETYDFAWDCSGVKFVVSKVGEGYDAHIRGLDRKLQLNPAGKGKTMLRTILIILLVLFLLGALPSWPYSAHWGYYPSGGLGLVLIIVVILIFLDIV